MITTHQLQYLNLLKDAPGLVWEGFMMKYVYKKYLTELKVVKRSWDRSCINYINKHHK